MKATPIVLVLYFITMEPHTTLMRLILLLTVSLVLLIRCKETAIKDAITGKPLPVSHPMPIYAELAYLNQQDNHYSDY